MKYKGSSVGMMREAMAMAIRLLGIVRMCAPAQMVELGGETLTYLNYVKARARHNPLNYMLVA